MYENMAQKKAMKLSRIFNSGKNSKVKYYVKEYLHYFLPSITFRSQCRRLISHAAERADIDYIKSRVDYYNKLEGVATLSSDALNISDSILRNYHGSKVYFFDTNHYLKYFPQERRYILKDGDITYVPKEPSLVKSRPIGDANSNSVLLNMDKVRHFVFLNDAIPFRDKRNMILYRGDTTNKPHRQRFLAIYFNHPMCDVGDTTQRCEEVKQYAKPKMSLRDHLEYKFIMALEGNDVASNLKWIMSSNSIAVMPRPTYETWFMEGKLIPGYHYIEIRPDYSDLIEQCEHYIKHPEQAEQIIANAHEYIKQFKDKGREKLISLLVLDKYFTHTL